MRNLSVIKGLYQGNGVTRRWAIPFEYNDTAQIFVTITTYDEGDYTYRVLDSTEYTIDEDSVEIVYPKTDDDAPIPSTQYLTVWRDTDLLQLMDLTNQGAAWPDSIEASLDKLHQIVQELAEGLSRSLKVDIGDPQTPDEKLVAIQDYVLAAAESSRSAATSEASAQRSAEAAATSEANAAESERLASGYADTATAAAGRAEDSAISARAYNAPEYDNAKTYQAGDVVTYTDGNSYRALQETTGNEPPNIIYWQKVTDYVGDNFFEVDEYGYIVPMDSPSHSRYWRVDQDGYIVPIEGGDGGYRPDTRSLSAEYLNVTNEGYVKHLRADDISAQEVDADEVTAEVAAFNTLTANAVNAGNINAYLAESTGYGIVSGCEPTISGLTVTVGAGVVHLADGTRKEIAQTNVTLDNADPTNPRIDLVYITSVGEVAKITGTAAASPVVPTLPTGGISVCNVTIAAGATTGTLTDIRNVLERWHNMRIINIMDYGAVGDGVTDDSVAIQTAVNTKLSGNYRYTIFFPSGTYVIKSNIYIPDNRTLMGGGWTSKLKIYPWAQITTKKDVGSVHNITISNMQITALINQSETIINPAELWNTVNLHLDHVQFNTQSEDGTATIDYQLREILIDRTSNSITSFMPRIERCQFNGCTLVDKISDGYILHNEIWNTKSHALELARAESTLVEGNQFVGGNVYGGILIRDNCGGLKIVHNYFDGSYASVNTNYGIFIDNDTSIDIAYCVISGNEFWEQKAGGIYVGTHARLYGSTIANNVFWDCDMYDNSIPDIKIVSSDSFGNVITGNTFGRNSAAIDSSDSSAKTRQSTPPTILMYSASNAPASVVSNNILFISTYYSASEYHNKIEANNPGDVNVKLDGGLAHSYIRPTSSVALSLNDAKVTGTVKYRISGGLCVMQCSINAVSANMAGDTISTNAAPANIDNDMYTTLSSTDGKTLLIRVTETGLLKCWGGVSGVTYYGLITYVAAE